MIMTALIMEKYALVALVVLLSAWMSVVKSETECKTRADIIFMVDSSTSIREFEDTRDNWQIIKDFIVNVTKQLPVRDDGIRIGAVKFATRVDTEDIIYLGQYPDKTELQRRINDLIFLQGATNTSGVIRHIYSENSKGMFGLGSDRDRPEVQNFGILITDGLSNIDSEHTKPEARIARLQHNIKIFTIGITKYANVDELQEIASDPVSHYHFLSPDFQHLNLLIDDLLLGLCREKPPPSAPCVDAQADIAFVLDSSGSIGPDHWRTLKHFVLAVVDSLDLANGKTRVAVVRYSTNATVEFYFDKYFGGDSTLSLTDMREEIMNLTHLDDRTNISGAIRVMRDHVFMPERGDRPDIKNIGILISDGKSTEEIDNTKREAFLTKQMGITMFVLGLTTDIDDNELQSIASDPLTDHFLNTTSIADVGALKSRLIWGICSDKCAQATEFDPDCWRNVTSYGCVKDEHPHWTHYPGHILLGHNYDRLENIPTPEECQRLCFQDPRCRSVDYVTRYRQCAVSYVGKDDAPLSFVEEASADYYELACSTRDGPGGDGPGGGPRPGTADPNGSTTKVSSKGCRHQVSVASTSAMVVMFLLTLHGTLSTKFT